MTTYHDYLQNQLSLSFDEMIEIHSQIITSIGSDTDAHEIYKELVEQATQYADYRAHWLLWSRDEKIEKDSHRTSCHDSLIIKFNMLARYLSMNGQNSTWRDLLGDEKSNPYVRKRIGDFACFLVFVNSINSR